MHSPCENENIPVWWKRIVPLQKKLLPFLPRKLLKYWSKWTSILNLQSILGSRVFARKCQGLLDIVMAQIVFSIFSSLLSLLLCCPLLSFLVPFLPFITSGKSLKRFLKATWNTMINHYVLPPPSVRRNQTHLLYTSWAIPDFIGIAGWYSPVLSNVNT